jgi:hypothetical protein
MSWLRQRRRCWWLGRGRMHVSANSIRRFSGILTMALLTMAMLRSSGMCTACACACARCVCMCMCTVRVRHVNGVCIACVRHVQ